MKLTLFLNLIQLQKKNECHKIEKERQQKQRRRARRKQVKYRRTNDNSQSAKSDYAWDDSGQGVNDIVKDVPQNILNK